MKIIIIGDLHGEFPLEVKEAIKKEKPDLILSTGDFANFDNYRKAVFSKISKTKSFDNKINASKKMINKIIKSMEKPIKELDSFNVPVYTIWGNLDYTNYEVNKHKIKTNSLNRLAKKSKNIKVVREKVLDFPDLQILMLSGYRKNRHKFPKKKTKKIEKFNNSWKNRLKKIFSKINPKKTTLFLCHDVPKDTKLDLINNPDNPLSGKHVGDEIIREFIEKYQPNLGICGHMHETQGVDKIGKTLVINAGYGRAGQFLVLEIKGDKIKYELKT